MDKKEYIEEIRNTAEDFYYHGCGSYDEYQSIVHQIAQYYGKKWYFVKDHIDCALDQINKR